MKYMHIIIIVEVDNDSVRVAVPWKYCLAWHIYKEICLSHLDGDLSW